MIKDEVRWEELIHPFPEYQNEEVPLNGGDLVGKSQRKYYLGGLRRISKDN